MSYPEPIDDGGAMWFAQVGAQQQQDELTRRRAPPTHPTQRAIEPELHESDVPGSAEHKVFQCNEGKAIMGFIATNDGGNFEMTPEGVHIARCYRMVDLGTQESEFQGQKKTQRKIMIGWELLGDDRMADGNTFAISKRYTLSMHEKAQLRRDLEAWRGRAFTREEEAQFDVSRVLGTYCMLNIMHEERNGKTYANIASIMPLPKGMPKPASPNPCYLFDIDAPDMEIYSRFGEKLKATIAAAPEWKVAGRGAGVAHGSVSHDEWGSDIVAEGVPEYVPA